MRHKQFLKAISWRALRRHTGCSLSTGSQTGRFYSIAKIWWRILLAFKLQQRTSESCLLPTPRKGRKMFPLSFFYFFCYFIKTQSFDPVMLCFWPNATFAGSTNEIEYILEVVEISRIRWKLLMLSRLTASGTPKELLILSTISFFASSNVSPLENPYTWIIGMLEAFQTEGSASAKIPGNTSRNSNASAGRFMYTWSKWSKLEGGASKMSSNSWLFLSFNSSLDSSS